MPFLAASLPQDVRFSSVWTVCVKPRCDNRNRSLCSSCNKVALEAMWKSTNHVIIWFGGWDKNISSPIGSCSIAVDFSHNFHLNALIKKSMTTDFEFFVFYFSSLKCEWYLMGIIILICYIFLIRDFQSMIFSGFFFFFLFFFSSSFVSALAHELLFQIYQCVVRIYLREKPDVFL